MLVQNAVDDAAAKPRRLILGERSIDTFFARLRDRLQALVDAGKLPEGEYVPMILIGTSRVAVRVRIQADLFGPASLSIDTAGLRDLLDAQRGG